MTDLHIVLTGVSRGLGRALTDRFVERGHTVSGCARSPTSIAALGELHGPPHAFEAVDVADEAAVAAWAERVLERQGPPDLLLNNAARMNRLAPLWEIRAEELDAMLSVNVAGPANVVRAFVPAMIERGRGVIVNVSSGWGRSTSPEVGPYCTTKYAIEGFTGSLAQELPSGLAAIAWSPGVIDTDMLRSAWGEAASAHENAEEWSHRAADELLSFGPKQNGRSLRLD